MRWLVLTVLLWGGCKERYDSYSTTLQEARPLIEKGWLPSSLPPSASDIHERHDIDSNWTWASLAFNPSERAVFERSLTESLEPVLVRNPDTAWWPVNLRGNVHLDVLEQAGLVMYRSKSKSGANFFMNWKVGRAYYWSPH